MFCSKFCVRCCVFSKWGSASVPQHEQALAEGAIILQVVLYFRPARLLVTSDLFWNYPSDAPGGTQLWKFGMDQAGPGLALLNCPGSWKFGMHQAGPGLILLNCPGLWKVGMKLSNYYNYRRPIPYWNPHVI